MGLLDLVNNRNNRLRKFNYLYNKLFVAKDGSKTPLRDTQHLMLYFSKNSSNFSNLAEINKFLLDKGHAVRYNRGKRYYKGLSCKLSPELFYLAVKRQNSGIHNKK